MLRLAVIVALLLALLPSIGRMHAQAEQSLHKNVQVYAFAQLPIYSNLDGYQLFPCRTANVRISAGF
ncbi:MAG: hypothetical protein ABI365_05510 [Lysobacteraceae bacterium]